MFSSENQNQVKVEAHFKFKPLSFSWVAIHPQPKGIIQFIGGALFGTFPTIFYDFFLRKLFQEGYTIIALPFRFTFDHWSVSLQLLREQYVLRKALIEEVKRLQYAPQIYLEDKNYRWIGHSLGCKYIILLELLSTFEDLSTVASKQQALINDLKVENYSKQEREEKSWKDIWQEYKPKIQPLVRLLNNPNNTPAEEKYPQKFLQKYCQSFLKEIEKEDRSCQKSEVKIENQLDNLKDKVKNIYDEWLKIREEIKKLVGDGIDLKGLFIRDQPSLLIAPDISDTSSAIPIKFVADFLDAKGLGAKPTKQQTQCLVRASSLFSITSIISFEKDMIAGNLENSTGDSDVAWLACILIAKGGNNPIEQIPNAYHLEPHGHQFGKYVIDFPGCIIVWSTGLAFAPLSPFSPPAKAFFNEVNKPIIKTLAHRAILEQTVLGLLKI
jgi:hypothetical protein